MKHIYTYIYMHYKTTMSVTEGTPSNVVLNYTSFISGVISVYIMFVNFVFMYDLVQAS